MSFLITQLEVLAAVDLLSENLNPIEASSRKYPLYFGF